jgi:hypothetical protein
MDGMEIGRLLRAGTTGFVVGCSVTQLESPSFGALVRVPLNGNYQIYGIIFDIHIDDDGLVRQLVTTEAIQENVIADNRRNRTIPVEMSVLSVGYRTGGKIYHLLPPRPALSLDKIFLCNSSDVQEFTSVGRFGYFRNILGAIDLPVAELIAAHLRQGNEAHLDAGDVDWFHRAMQELIILLRDDYQTLMGVLSAVSDI